MVAIAEIDLGGILDGATSLVDELVTSGEEKLAVQAELMKAQHEITKATLDYERAVFEMQSKVLLAEIQSKHWLPANWRPVTMLSFVFMMLWNWIAVPMFGQEPVEYPDWVGTAFITGLGGYVVGRSAEKIAKTISLNPTMMKTPWAQKSDDKERKRLFKAYKREKDPELKALLLEELKAA